MFYNIFLTLKTCKVLNLALPLQCKKEEKIVLEHRFTIKGIN